MRKATIFNVGPVDNLYYGVHTYADVLFPLVKALKNDVRFTWVGITLENRIQNTYLEAQKIKYSEYDVLSITADVDYMSKSWDLIDISEFDFFWCQPRPLTNKIENDILLLLINKFLDAGKPVFVWEQDMFISVAADDFKQSAVKTNFSERMMNEVILLHPAVLPPVGFKNTHFFPFSMYDRELQPNVKRDDDFIFIGNVYSRQDQAIRFFGKLNDVGLRKVVYGDWTKDEQRKAFASQFTNFEFRGSTEHWAAIPLMQRAKATLHIVPEFAEARGLMTARTFTSQMAGILCFVDEKIFGANEFYPDILIVKDGDDIKQRWDYCMKNYDSILAQRQELMKDFTIDNRVKQLLTEIFPKYGLV